MTTSEKVALKLTDRLLKFTVTIEWLDGSKTELQTNDEPSTNYDEKLREPILRFGYNEKTMARLVHVRCWTTTENTNAPQQAIP